MNTESSSSKSVTTRTRTLGLCWRILRVASIPFTSGICRSINITSGCKSAARATASSPVFASPTTSNSGTDESREIMPFRKRGWSSAMRMRRVSNFSLLRTLLGQWQTDQHPGTALFGTFDYATAAKLRCSLTHRGEAHPRATLCWDAHAIVDDLKPHFLIECKAHDAAV